MSRWTCAHTRFLRLFGGRGRSRPLPPERLGVRAYADDPVLVLPLPWDGPLLAVPVRTQRQRPRPIRR
ncbi:MAG: hypothetical protein AB7W59_01035 [Acidimicrobiia bacterium]